MKSSQLVKNLEFLMGKRMETPNAVAVSCGIMASTMMRLLDGSSAAPRNSTLQALAMHFGVHPEKLLNADLSVEIEELVEHKNISEPISLLTEEQIYQVYCWNEADTTEGLDNSGTYFRLTNERVWLPAPPDQELIDVINNNPDSLISPVFAFKIKGEAMAPTFRDGDIVFVRYRPDEYSFHAGEPAFESRLPERIKLKNGDFVLTYVYKKNLARKEDRKRIVVRQYFEDDMTGGFFLMPTNPNWPAERLTVHDPCMIIGKIVGRYTKF